MKSAEITGRMSMHGWAEVYLPGAGWIGFDPSWGILAASQYVPVAVTRHPEHAPPITGSFFGYTRDFLRTEVDLYVRRLDAPEPGAENIAGGPLASLRAAETTESKPALAAAKLGEGQTQGQIQTPVMPRSEA